MSATKMNRRGFVGMLGAGCLAGLCSAQLAQAAGADMTWDEEFDIVVVGCGGAGASAAILASEAGSKVLVLEKNATGFGSSTALSGQAIMGVGTKQQKECGYEDSVEEALKYFLEVGDGEENLIRTILEGSAEAIEWLESLGCEFPADENLVPGLTRGGQEDLYADLTKPVPRSHWSSSGIWTYLEKRLEEDGIEVRWETPAVALVRSDGSNEIAGVVAEGESGRVRIRARQAVILAAGGFSRNYDMKRALLSKNKIWSGAGLHDDGDGMKLGISAGAMVGYFGAIESPYYSDPMTACELLIMGSSQIEGHPPFIMVNEAGERFSNEGKFYAYTAEDIVKQHGGHAYLISGGEYGEQSMTTHSSTGARYELNTMWSADTLEELSATVGINPEGLASTVEAWNAYCAAEKDDAYGRTRDLVPIESGPYYASEVVPGDGSTFGGVWVDNEMHALDAVSGEPIPRLYAAGQNSIALGRFYPTCGSAVSTCIVTGRIAGAVAATEVPVA